MGKSLESFLSPACQVLIISCKKQVPLLSPFCTEETEARVGFSGSHYVALARLETLTSNHLCLRGTGIRGVSHHLAFLPDRQTLGGKGTDSLEIL